MAAPRVDRRLAAILAADVVGYSSLMERDEDRTLARLKAHRKELIEPLIAEYQGRIVKLMGDGALVEFASVVDAVRCAVLIQQGMAEREAEAPETERIRFRIGINLGDVIHEVDGDLYGDGVNVAARLEQLAEPGGVVVSGTAFDHLQGKLDLPLEFAGEQRVKNIERLVRAYRVRLDGTVGRFKLPFHRVRRFALPTVAVLLLALIVAAASGSWWWWRQSRGPTGPALADRPSVAVLPFANLSGDKGQDYFSDGLTDDLLTELARIPRLIVMSRNATAKYKGQAVDVPQAGRELGVRYMVEGSVQRAGEQMRITAQLIDAASDAHVWAERYDRPTKEISAVQDEMTRAIAGSLIVNISHEDLERAKRKPPGSLSAYDLFLRGREQPLLQTPQATARAIELYEQAVAADPTYADAMGQLALAYFSGFTTHWGPIKGRAALDRAYETAQHALALDPTSPYAARALSQIYLFTHRPGEAVAVLEQAIKSNPSNDALLFRLGDTYTYAGQPERGIELLRQVYQLNPRYTGSGHAFIGRGLLLLNRHEEALAELKTCALLAPAFRPCYELAAVAYAEMGRLDEARAAAMEAHRVDPDFTLATAADVLPFKNPQDLQRFLDGLRKAGLTEK